MKKHIFGFALFSLIVASFVFAYAFLCAPSIPSKEAVKPPVSQKELRSEKPYSCYPKRNKLSYEVLSSQYFVAENKIVSKIRVSFNGSIGMAPSKIYVTTTYSSAGNVGKDGFGENKVLENPFAYTRELVVDVVSRVSSGKKLDIDENLYALVSVTDYDGSANYKNNEDITKAKPVLFVYDEKPETIQRAKKNTE